MADCSFAKVIKNWIKVRVLVEIMSHVSRRRKSRFASRYGKVTAVPHPRPIQPKKPTKQNVMERISQSPKHQLRHLVRQFPEVGELFAMLDVRQTGLSDTTGNIGEGLNTLASSLDSHRALTKFVSVICFAGFEIYRVSD
jgi:hypothetical protein